MNKRPMRAQCGRCHCTVIHMFKFQKQYNHKHGEYTIIRIVNTYLSFN